MAIEKKAILLYKTESILGEGPVWLEESMELLWVDISKGEVNCLNLTTNLTNTIYQGEKPSCIVPVDSREILIADKNKIVLFNRQTQNVSTFLETELPFPNMRFNDGKADPNGKLWLGTMEMDIKPHCSALYSIDSEANAVVNVKGVTISNGLTWSLDRKTMYYIDTGNTYVYAFDFNEKSEISNQRIAIDIPKNLGAPDGMTIDVNGNLWVAMWGGFSVTCWNPVSGDMIEKIYVDAPHVTSCTFGGKKLESLFITTARESLTERELEKYPYSGSIFSVEPGVHGTKVNHFKK